MVDWSIYDPEGAMRQRYIDLDELTDRVRDRVAKSELGWNQFQEMFDISWIYHENGLEGVVLTYPEIKSAVDNKIISDVSLLPTYQDIKNQKNVIDLIRERAQNRRFQVTIPFLKELHGMLVDDPAMVGVYRKDIPIHRTYFHDIAQPSKIEKELQAVLDFLKARHGPDMHPVELAAIVHHRFLRVFPFSRYSGMLGRLMANFVLFRHGYLPCIIHASDRQRYYEALRNGEKAFREFVCESIDNSLENAVRFFEASSKQRTA